MIDRFDEYQQDRKTFWQKMLVPLAFVCLAAIPIMYYGTNSELAKWKAAQAQLLYDAGETERGIEMMELALDQSPRDQNLKLDLASQLMPAGRAEEALELIQEVLDQSSNPRMALYAKSECLQHLKRPQEALAALKEIPEYAVPGAIKDFTRLNNLAYNRALAGLELDEAEQNIDDAVELYLSGVWWLDKIPMTLEDQTLVVTAMIANRIDRTDLVLNELTKRIVRVEELQRSIQQDVSEEIYRNMQDGLPVDKDVEKEYQKHQMILHSQKQYLAVMYTVRALIYQRTGDLESCDRDRLSAASWDHSPDELLRYFPSDWDLLTLAHSGSLYLDTRAMVTWAKSKDFEDAIGDLNRSILALEILDLTRDTDMQNSLHHEEYGRNFEASVLKRNEATIRKHRADILIEHGLVEKAEADLERIRELGFDDNDELF